MTGLLASVTDRFRFADDEVRDRAAALAVALGVLLDVGLVEEARRLRELLVALDRSEVRVFDIEAERDRRRGRR